MKKFKKKFQVWVHNGTGYTYNEYDTLEEAILAPKCTDDWYLTESVNVTFEQQ